MLLLCRSKDDEWTKSKSIAKKAVTLCKFNIPKIHVNAEFYHWENFDEIDIIRPSGSKLMSDTS